MTEAFSEKEIRIFSELDLEKSPPPSLEKKVLDRLHVEQLVVKSDSIFSSGIKLIGIVVATSLIIFCGYYFYNASKNVFIDAVIQDCDPIEGLDMVTGQGRILLLGELHGTNEAPGFVKKVICNNLKSGKPLTICLELPENEQLYVDEFLKSEGTQSDRQKLLSANTWSREYQDGRNSKAMFDLIDHIRKLMKNNIPIRLLLIDDPSSPDRDYAMATNILEDQKQHPDDFYVTLVGNYHNRISRGAGSTGEILLNNLGASRITSLNQLYGSGTAWVCIASEGCGIFGLSGRDGNTRGIIMETVDEGADYHGYYGVGPISATPPAREAF